MFSYRWLLLLIGIQSTLILDASTQDLWHQHHEHHQETTTGASTRIRLSNGYFKVSENDQWRVEQYSGKRISGEIFDAVGDFQENMLPVKKNNLWGFLHSSGKLMIDFEYEHISPFIHNISISRKENAWYLINALDRSSKKLAIDYYSGREKNRLVVYKNGKKGYLDLNGKLLAPGWMEANLTTPVHRTNSSLQVNNNTCPPNVNFEEGIFNQWECFIGFVQAQGNQNVITMSPNTPVPADPNRHLIIPRTTPAALDFYGNFPVNPPDGSNFAVKLGNIQVGAQAERIRYRIDVPTGAQQFFVVFQYAVVYEEPVNGQPHTPWEHPRFTARLFDPSTNSADLCANFDFNSSDATGFQTSPILSSRGEPVLYKPWQSVFVNLTKYAGRTVYLEFTTADCTKTGHWGYAYVDVDDCDLNIVAQNSCLNNSTVLKGPTGFSNIKWWNNNFTVKYGEGNSLNINPALAPNTAVKIELTPFSGNACKDTASVIIASQQLSVELGNDKNVCAGDSVFIGLTPKPNLSYQWTSAPTLSATNIANPKAFPLVTTKYYLRITDTETGCTARDSITVNIRPKPILTVNSPSICPGQSAQLNASGAGTYVWSPSVGLNNTSGATVTAAPAVTSTYTVTGTDPVSGCKNAATSIVTISPKPIVRVNSDTICSGTTIALNASGADNYTWSPNTFLSATSGSTVNSTPTSSITYQIIGTNAGTGCKDTTTTDISILPLPNIRLNNAAICVGKEARLFVSGGINYTWGTGSNITTLAPDTILVKPASTATYSVTGTDSTNGCKKTVQTTVIVNPLPALSINTPSICIGNSATITVSGANQYAWTPHPTLNTLTGASVTVSPATTTGYSVTGRNTSTGCENTTSTSVTVNPLPTGGITINGNNQFICDGYSVALIGTGGDTYQWYLNNAAIPGATSSTYQATRTGTYALELTSPFGCKNFVTSRPAFTVLTKPKADFRPPSGCIGNTLSFTNLSQSGQSGPVIYQWNFGDNSGSDLQNPQHTYLNKGAYSASLKIIPTTCPMLYDSSSSLVIIEAPVPGIRYPTVNTLINSSTTLRARNFGLDYLWQPSQGLNNPFIMSPVFTDDEENDYIIQITNAYGCVTYDSVKVRIFGFSDIQIPTAFSPNGDGHNDKLDVFLIGIRELTFFKVFNRWGQLMFETKDRLELWDGRFKDKDQPLETYVWIAQGIGVDGKKITKRGQTVLIR